jgi:hypothetical protein
MQGHPTRAGVRASSPGRRGAARLATAALALLLGFDAAAAPKTDVVFFENGDRLTGEVKGLSQGQLTFNTDATGDITIEWDDIARIESRQWLQVETTNGARYTGHADAANEAGSLVVVGMTGTPRSLPMAEVVRIAPIERGRLIDRLDGYLTAGYDYTKASSLQTFSFTGGLKLRNEGSQWTLEGETYLTAQSGNDDSQRYTLNGGYRYLLPERQFVQGFATLEGNDELGLDLRATMGAAYGQYLRQTNLREWVAYGGAAVTKEQFAGDETQQNLEAVLGTQYSYFRYDSPKASMDFTLNLFPSLTDFGRYRLDSRLRSRYELVKDLFFEISLFAAYDSDPGDEARSNSDYSLVTSLGYSF